MTEGEAEFKMSELFQDIPTTVGCLWKNIAAVFSFLIQLSQPLEIEITKALLRPPIAPRLVFSDNFGYNISREISEIWLVYSITVST